MPDGNIVRVPVQRVATCSSIFAGEYKQFGDIEKIIAVSEPEYYNIPEIKKGIRYRQNCQFRNNNITKYGEINCLKT